MTNRLTGVVSKLFVPPQVTEVSIATATSWLKEGCAVALTALAKCKILDARNVHAKIETHSRGPSPFVIVV